jgi:hypothetical protein
MLIIIEPFIPISAINEVVVPTMKQCRGRVDIESSILNICQSHITSSFILFEWHYDSLCESFGALGSVSRSSDDK